MFVAARACAAAAAAAVLVVSGGCIPRTSAPPPAAPALAQPEPPPTPPEPAEPAPLPPRTDFAVGESPTSLVVAGSALVWTDSMGAIWTMPTAGGPPRQLTEQRAAGFMFHPVSVGTDVLVSTKRDFARVTLPGGPVRNLGLALAEDPVDIVADDHTIYTTLFKRDELLAIPVGGGIIGTPTKLASVRRAVLAVHGPTLYAVSYATGRLVSLPITGGKLTQIARGLERSTALAVDDTAAYLYSEKDQTLRKVELATGAITVLATQLTNSDDLVSDGPWLYTYSWPSRVLRIAKDGSGQETLADDLASPSHIAIDARAIYVVSRDQNKIVRLAKRR